MVLRLTKNLHTRVVDEKQRIIGLYNPIRGHHFAFIKEEVLNNLKEGNVQETKELESLIENNFLVQNNFSEEEYFNLFKKNLDQEIHLMYLLLTQDCNLNCGYCFEDLDKRVKGKMSKEVADKAIDYFFNVSKPERKIIFYGGEPLIDKEVFLSSVRKIKNKETEYKDAAEISMVTNGTLIDNEIAIFIKENKVKTAISIDGPQKIHDSARKNISGRGSYSNAIHGYNLLKDIGANPSISCTVGKHNAYNLGEVADFFINELKPCGIGFNFMIEKELSENSLGIDIENATKAVLSASEMLRKNGIYEDRIMRRLDSIINNKVHLKDCAAYGNQIVVRYDGTIGPCHAFSASEKYFETRVLSKDVSIDNNSFETWANRSQLNNPDCKDCAAILLCGGGCAYNSFINTGNLNSKDTQICTHTKMLIDYVLEETWKKSN